MWKQGRSIALVIVLLAASGVAFAAKGKLGFSTEATSSGFESPVLEKLTVAEVRPGSPAAGGGLRSGDHITEVNGRAIAGEPAGEVANLFKELEVGQKVSLKITRGTDSLSLNLVAAP